MYAGVVRFVSVVRSFESVSSAAPTVAVVYVVVVVVVVRVFFLLFPHAVDIQH